MYLASTNSDRRAGDGPSNAPDAEPRLQPVQTTPEPPWPVRVHHVTDWLARELSRPRVRLCVVGVGLLLLGAFVFSSSMWTLPLIIVGAVMVGIAWVGSRLNGRFAVEWGETGAQLEFRAKISSAVHPRSAQLPAPAAPRTGPPIGHGSPSEPLDEPEEPTDAEVVEGEAHTVEIDVAELKALIAAAEAEEIRIARADTVPRAAVRGDGPSASGPPAA
jgi:hypothetical protein